MTTRKSCVLFLILKQKAFFREFSATKATQGNKEEVKAATLEFLSQLSAKLKVKEWTDWYNISEKKVNYFGGTSVLKRFRSLFPTSNKSVTSLANALMKVYPQYPWNLQNFKDFVEVDSVKRFWQEKKNQKHFLEQLSKSLGYKNWEDWYELQHLDILKQGGIGLLNACSSSIVEAITSNFPEYPWKPWRFKEAPPTVWKEPKYHREFFEYAKEKLSIQNMEDWYAAKLSDLQSIGGQVLLKNHYGNAVSSFIPAMVPEHTWLEWKFKEGVPQTYWRNVENQRKFITYVGQQLKVEKMEDWYSTTPQNIRGLGGSSLILHYNGDIVSVFQALFPEFSWNRDLFEKPKEAQSYWKNPQHLRHYFDRIASKFGVQNLDDWYKVTYNELSNFGGIHMLNHYGKSLPKALSVAYPEHQWQPWRFERATKHFWNEEANVREVLKWIEDTLDIRTLDDWYGITTQQLNSMGFAFLLQKHGGIAELLQKYYPGFHRGNGNKLLDHNWNFVQPRALNKKQNFLFKVVAGIFPAVDAIANHPMEALRYDTTGRPMELDIFIPAYNIGFEYQGQQHFKSHFFNQDDTQLEKDHEKRNACKKAGIALVEIPYWWDGSREAIESAILEVRPDLRSKMSSK